MKKIMMYTLLLVITTSSFSQSITRVPVSREDYLKKSKNQKTAAWILLGGGTVLIGTGFLIGDREESSFDDAATGGIIAATGLLAAIGSIPLFIASGKNKRKGMATIAFRNVSALQLKNSSMVYKTIPAVSLKINL